MQVRAQQQRVAAVEMASREHAQGLSRRLRDKDTDIESLQKSLLERSGHADMLRRLHLDEAQRAARLEAQVTRLEADCRRLDDR